MYYEYEDLPAMLIEKTHRQKGHCQNQAPMRALLVLLEKARRPEVNSMTSGGWQSLPKPMVVDSGAGETVLPSGWFKDHPTHVSKDRLGEFFTTADGSRV